MDLHRDRLDNSCTGASIMPIRVVTLKHSQVIIVLLSCMLANGITRRDAYDYY